MIDPLDRGFLQATAKDPDSLVRSGRADAAFAISMLGAKAQKHVPTSSLMQFGKWLGWPDWLRDGTTLSEPGPLPPMISIADDLTIVGNIIDNADYLALVRQMLAAPRAITGPVGTLLLLHAPDVGLALGALVRAMIARNPYAVITLVEYEDTVEIAFLQQWPIGRLYRFMALVGATLTYRAIESLYGNDLTEMTLETQWHDVPEAQQLLTGFHCRISPSSEGERVRFPRAWLATTNAEHDPLVWAVARTKLAALENECSEPEDVAAVRTYIVKMLAQEQRVPRLKQAAAQLELSSRTIVRLLARHNTSFHGLVEQERKARAMLVIADRSVSLAEAARLLGFSDMSSFGRSFRNWFGDTPGNVRNAWAGGVIVAP